MAIRPAVRFSILGCLVFLVALAFPIAGFASVGQMEMGNPSAGSSSMDMGDTANCCPDMDTNGSRACPYLSPCHISTGSRIASGVSACITALKPEFRIRLSPTHPSSRLVSQTQGLGPPGAAILFCNLRT